MIFPWTKTKRHSNKRFFEGQSDNRLSLSIFFMSSPIFFHDQIANPGEIITLSEEGSRHIISVLRMKVGEAFRLSNGQGTLLSVEITAENKKRCEVRVLSQEKVEPPHQRLAIGISLVKNASRFEWFLEKATEIGVSEIYPLLCHRTEKQHFRQERMQGIITSAMLQSQQAWLPKLYEPTKLTDFLLQSPANYQQKFIAHCEEEQKTELISSVRPEESSAIILIGPEGDFTPDEITQSKKVGFKPVSLGNTRLRTETAGIVAVTLLKFSFLPYK